MALEPIEEVPVDMKINVVLAERGNILRRAELDERHLHRTVLPPGAYHQPETGSAEPPFSSTERLVFCVYQLWSILWHLRGKMIRTFPLF
jgi:hypothetical protein